MDINNARLFTVNDKFDSWESLLEQKKLYEQKNKCSLSIGRSKTFQNASKKKKMEYNSKLLYYESKFICSTIITDQKTSQQVKCPFEVFIRSRRAINGVGPFKFLTITKIIDKNTGEDFSNHTHMITEVVDHNIEAHGNENSTIEEDIHSTTTTIRKIEEESNDVENFTFASIERTKNRRFENFNLLMEKLQAELLGTLNVEEQIEKLNAIQGFKDNIEQTVCSANITFSEFLIPSKSRPSTSKNSMETVEEQAIQQSNIDNISIISTNQSSVNIEVENNNFPPVNSSEIENQPDHLPPLKLENVDDPSGSSQIDLNMITFASKSSRGRRKGSSTKAIGLPSNHRSTISLKQNFCDQELPLKNFEHYTQKEKELKILQSIFSDKIGVKIMDSKYKIQKKDMKPISATNIADCVVSYKIEMVKKYFTQQAFIKLQTEIDIKNRNGPWTCEHCKKPLSTKCVLCEACLYWYNWSCMGLKEEPKEEIWYCRSCEKQLK